MYQVNNLLRTIIVLMGVVYTELAMLLLPFYL